MVSMSLQHRITILIVLFSIILISAFIAIQLRNQLSVITLYNLDRSKLGGKAVKSGVENMLRNVDGSSVTIDDIKKDISEELNDLKNEKVVDESVLFAPDGTVIASTLGKFQPDRAWKADDIAKVKDVLSAVGVKKWFRPYVDKLNNRVDFYIPIEVEETYPYVIKASFALGNIKEAMIQVYKPAIISALMVIIANIALGMLLSRSVVKPIKILNDATKEVADGKLEMNISMDTGDELEELADTFNDMTAALMKMRAKAENANPLTKLPGNIVIHDEIDNRIKTDVKFAVIYSDLDNFKAFNDKYGIGSGDQAIKLTADILKESLKHGNSDDLLGHEGGDDFVLITTPDKTKTITDYICKEFDKRIRQFYSKEDLDQGFIMASSRDSQIKKFPIMTISLAGVTNEQRPIQSYAEVTNICAEVKKKAKSLNISSFVLDKRA